MSDMEPANLWGIIVFVLFLYVIYVGVSALSALENPASLIPRPLHVGKESWYGLNLFKKNNLKNNYSNHDFHKYTKNYLYIL